MVQHLIVVLFGSVLLAAEAQNTELPQLRLNGSDSRCEGLVEILHPFNLQNEGPYGQACRTNATGDAEAMVICRQLNCDSEEARRVDPVQFGFSEAVDVYVAFNYSCTGNELRITDCEQIPFSEAMSECYGDEASFAIAVKCGGEPESAPMLLLNIGLLVLFLLLLK